MAKHVISQFMKKGWTAYVRGYKTYTKQYDKINWNRGTVEPKREIKEVGAVRKEIIKF